MLSKQLQQQAIIPSWLPISVFIWYTTAWDLTWCFAFIQNIYAGFLTRFLDLGETQLSCKILKPKTNRVE